MKPLSILQLLTLQLIFLQLLDILTTYYAMTYGSCYESNPLMRMVIEQGFHWFVLLKIVGITILIFILNQIKYNSIKIGDYLFLNIGYIFIIANNMAEII